MSDHVDDHVLLSDSEIAQLYRQNCGSGFAVEGAFRTLFEAAEKVGLSRVRTFDAGSLWGVVGFAGGKEVVAISEYESDGPWAVNITTATKI